MRSAVPKVFLDAFPEDKPTIHYVDNPIGCPDRIELNEDGSQTHYFSSSRQKNTPSNGINPFKWVRVSLQDMAKKVLSYGKA